MNTNDPNALPSVQSLLDQGVHPSNFFRDDERLSQVPEEDATVALSKPPEEALRNLQMNIKRTEAISGGSDNLLLPRDAWMPKWTSHKNKTLEDAHRKFKEALGFFDKVAMGTPEGAISTTEVATTPAVGVAKGVIQTADAIINFASSAATMAGRFLDPLVPDNRFTETIYDVLNDVAEDGQKLQRFTGLDKIDPGWISTFAEGYLQWQLGTKLLGALGRLTFATRNIGAIRAGRNFFGRIQKAVEIAAPSLKTILTEGIPAYYLGHMIGVDPERPQGGTPSVQKLIEMAGSKDALERQIKARSELLEYRKSIGDPHGRFSLEQFANSGIAALFGGILDMAILGALKLKNARPKAGWSTSIGGSKVPTPGAPGSPPPAAPVGEAMGAPADATKGTAGAATGIADDILKGTTKSELADLGAQLAALDSKLKGAAVEPVEAAAVAKAASEVAAPGSPTAAPAGAAPGAPDVPPIDIKVSETAIDDASKDFLTLVKAAETPRLPDAEVPMSGDPVAAAVDLEVVKGELQAVPKGKARGTVKPIKTTEITPEALKAAKVSGTPTIGPTKEEAAVLIDNIRGFAATAGSVINGTIEPTNETIKVLAGSKFATDGFRWILEMSKKAPKGTGLKKLEEIRSAVLSHPELVPQANILDELVPFIRAQKKAKGLKTNRGALTAALEVTTGVLSGTGLAIYMDEDGLDGVVRDPSKVAKYVLGMTLAAYGGRAALEKLWEFRAGTKTTPRDPTVFTYAQEKAAELLVGIKGELGNAISRLKANNALTKADKNALYKDYTASMRDILKATVLVGQLDDTAMSPFLAALTKAEPTTGVKKGLAFLEHPNPSEALKGTESLLAAPNEAVDFDEFLLHINLRGRQAATVAPNDLTALAQQHAKVIAGYTGETAAVVEKRLLADPVKHAETFGIIQQMGNRVKKAQELLKASTVDQEAVDLTVKELGILQRIFDGNYGGARQIFDSLPIIRNFSKDALALIKEKAEIGAAETFARFSALSAGMEQVKSLRTAWYIATLSRLGILPGTFFGNVSAVLGEQATQIAGASWGLGVRAWKKLTGGKVDPNLTTFGDYFGSLGHVLSKVGDITEAINDACVSGIKRHALTSAEAVASKTAGMTQDWLPRLLRADPKYPLYWGLKYIGDKAKAIFNGLVALDEGVGAIVIKLRAYVAACKELRATGVPKGVDPVVYAEKVYQKILQTPEWLNEQLKDSGVMTMNNAEFSGVFQTAYDLAAKPAMSVVSPFPKVAFNMIKYLYDNALAPIPEVFKGVLRGTADSPEFQKHIGKLGYAWSVAALANLWYSRGLIVIADDETRGTDKVLGLVSRSYIKVPALGIQIPLTYLGPAAPLAILGAGFSHFWNRYAEADDDQTNAIAAAFSAVLAAVGDATENTFTENMEDLMAVFNGDLKRFNRIGSRFLQGFYPGILVDIENVKDMWSRSKDIGDFVFNKYPIVKASVSLMDRVMRTGRERRSLLNDPVAGSSIILRMTPINDSKIYTELKKISLDDTPYVETMDSAFTGQFLPNGPALEFKRNKTAEYIRELWDRHVGDPDSESKNPRYWSDPKIGNNPARRAYITKNVIIPALTKAQMDTELEYREIYDAARLNKELQTGGTQAIVDVRAQEELGVPSRTPQRLQTRQTIDELIGSLGTSGGK